MSTVKLPNGKEVSLKRLSGQAQSRIRRGGAFAFKNKYNRTNQKRIIHEEMDDFNGQPEI